MKRKLIYITPIIIFIIFSIKLIFILSDKYYYSDKLLEKTTIYVNGYSAPRGRILDTNGKVLVDNIGIKTIYYNKLKNITIKEELDIAKKLSEILDIKEASISEQKEYYLLLNDNGRSLITDKEYQLLNERKITKKEIDKLKRDRISEDLLNYSREEKKLIHIYYLMNKGYSYGKKEIKKDVLDSEYAKILESNIPGITGELTWERVYPYKDTLRNILGSVGSIPAYLKDEYLNKGYELTDIVGVSYLEYQYEDYLKGDKAKYLVNSDNSLKLIEEEKMGNDLVLSIDIDIQKSIEKIVEDKILLGKKYNNTEYYKDSYVILGNPINGSIKAIVGRRLNNDNTFSDISLNNINKSFTIGSAVKGASIGVGYKYNLIKHNEVMKDSCVKLHLVPKKCSFKDLGYVNDLEALANSSNFYQYMIAIRLTGNKYSPNMKLNATKEDFLKYRNMFASFGLGVKTNIDLPKEEIGIIGKTVADDLLLNLAIGQYDTYTPIEVLQYINSIASGNRVSLSLMEKIVNNNSIIKEKKIDILNKVDLEDKDLDRIKEGLKKVLSEGTGKFYVPQGLNFAGKTGTSETFVGNVATITSTFTGFYPVDNPMYSLVVITPNISHKEGKTDDVYYGASKITKDVVKLLNEG